MKLIKIFNVSSSVGVRRKSNSDPSIVVCSGFSSHWLNLDATHDCHYSSDVNRYRLEMKSGVTKN